MPSKFRNEIVKLNAELKSKLKELSFEDIGEGLFMPSDQEVDLKDINKLVKMLGAIINEEIFEKHIKSIFLNNPNIGMQENGNNVVSQYVAPEEAAKSGVKDGSVFIEHEKFGSIIQKAYDIHHYVKSNTGNYSAERSQANLAAIQNFRANVNRQESSNFIIEQMFAIEDIAYGQQFSLGVLKTIANAAKDIQKENLSADEKFEISMRIMAQLATLPKILDGLITGVDNAEKLGIIRKTTNKMKKAFADIKSSYANFRSRNREDSMSLTITRLTKIIVSKIEESSNKNKPEVIKLVNDIKVLQHGYANKPGKLTDYFMKLNEIIDTNLNSLDGMQDILSDIKDDLPRKYLEIKGSPEQVRYDNAMQKIMPDLKKDPLIVRTMLLANLASNIPKVIENDAQRIVVQAIDDNSISISDIEKVVAESDSQPLKEIMNKFKEQFVDLEVVDKVIQAVALKDKPANDQQENNLQDEEQSSPSPN